VKKIIFNIGAVFFILFSVSYAHKINVFYNIENGKIIISSYFSDGTPARNAKVKVIDEKTGKIILTGKTNNKGEFSFKLLPPGNYEVIIKGELGHRAVTEILKEDILDTESEKWSQNESFQENTNQIKDINIKDIENTQISSTEKSYISSNLKLINSTYIFLLFKNQKKILKELETIKAQNKLLKRKLLKIEEILTKPNLIEILGGIGWILGIFGGIALFGKRN